MVNENIAANMLSAIIKELEAVESKATATIQMILYNSVGIADHSNVLDEIIIWAQRGAEANDAKRFLLNKFTKEEDK
jgi:site-specific recombinase